ncbi:SpaA isopeptide-forming pilin-related protein, partial [Enterococcus faecium]
ITVKDDGQTFEYTATNNLKKGVVKVHKVDQDGKPLADAEFTLTDEKG